MTAIDLAMHIVRVRHLKSPQDSREAFALLEQAGWIDTRISQHFLEYRPDDLGAFSSAILSSSEEGG